MALESGINNINKREKDQGRDIVDPKLGEDGTIWYSDKTGNIIKLDEAGDAEFNSQMQGNPPSAGWPEFSKRIASQNIPTTSAGVDQQQQNADVNQQQNQRQNQNQQDQNVNQQPQDQNQAQPEPTRGTEPSDRGPGGRGPGGRGPVDPDLIFGGGPDTPAPLPRGLVNRETYEIDRREYAGLNPKPVREILADERSAQLYGETLRSLGHPDLEGVLRRYADGTQTQQDMSFMTWGAYENARSLKIAEEANAKMTKAEVELLGRRDTAIFNLISHEGPDRALEIVKNTILHVAMRHPDDVIAMRDAMSGLKKDRDTFRYKRAEAKINALCKRVGIERSEYGKVFDLRDSAARQRTKEDLERRFRQQASGFRRFADWAMGDFKKTNAITLGSSRHAAIRAMMAAEKATPDIGPTAWVLHKIDDGLETIASHLGAAVDTPEIRRLVALESTQNKDLLRTSELGPRSLAQVQTLRRDRFSPQGIENRIRQRMQQPDWPRDATAQDAEVRSMKAADSQEHSQGGGFWAWFFSALFGADYDRAASAALGRPVRV